MRRGAWPQPSRAPCVGDALWPTQVASGWCSRRGQDMTRSHAQVQTQEALEGTRGRHCRRGAGHLTPSQLLTGNATSPRSLEPPAFLC